MPYSPSHSQPESPSTLFELKLWIYRIYKEVEHWTKIAVATLKELQSDTPKERRKITLSTRSRRRWDGDAKRVGAGDEEERESKLSQRE